MLATSGRPHRRTANGQATAHHTEKSPGRGLADVRTSTRSTGFPHRVGRARSWDERRRAPTFARIRHRRRVPRTGCPRQQWRYFRIVDRETDTASGAIVARGTHCRRRADGTRTRFSYHSSPRTSSPSSRRPRPHVLHHSSTEEIEHVPWSSSTAARRHRTTPRSCASRQPHSSSTTPIRGGWMAGPGGRTRLSAGAVFRSETFNFFFLSVRQNRFGTASSRPQHLNGPVVAMGPPDGRHRPRLSPSDAPGTAIRPGGRPPSAMGPRATPFATRTLWAPQLSPRKLELCSGSGQAQACPRHRIGHVEGHGRMPGRGRASFSKKRLPRWVC